MLDGSSRLLWNIVKFLLDSTATHPYELLSHYCERLEYENISEVQIAN